MSGSWTNITSGSLPNGGWTDVANSYTGQYVIACNNNDTHLYVSSDYGANWSIPSGIPYSSPHSAGWGGVAISQDGTLMAACGGNGSADFDVYLFMNGSWTTITDATEDSTHPGNSLYWISIAFSIDQTTLAAVNNTNSKLWLYNISTGTWTHMYEQDIYYSSLTSNSRGFISAVASNIIKTVYKDINNNYVVTLIFPDLPDVPVHNSNFPTPPRTNSSPSWTSVSSTLDGSKIVLSAQGSQFIYTVNVSTVNGADYWTFKTELAPGAGEWKKVQFGPDAISVVACSGDQNGTPATGNIWVGAYNGSSYDWTQQRDGNGNLLLGDWYSISRNLDKSTLTKFVTVAKNYDNREKNGIWIFTSTKSAQDTQDSFNQTIACFKSGTKIETIRGDVLIQDLKKGDLIKTYKHGFVPMAMIGKKEIHHIGSQERIKDQLYRYPSFTHDDLILTGCHAILKGRFDDIKQKDDTMKLLGQIYVTDDKYRVPACLDQKSIVYEYPNNYIIYHLALENPDYYMNYGIYANGVLVESCSKRYLKEVSGMKIL
jgi:hypothetical protein